MWRRMWRRLRKTAMASTELASEWETRPVEVERRAAALADGEKIAKYTLHYSFFD